MARKLQIKRGKKANMPTLAEGELGFATDEKSVYIGTGTENVPVAAPLDNTMSDASENGVKNKAIKTYVDSQDAALNTAIGTKVDKVTGKGLSTNDYTTAEKDKLAGIEGNANRYTHPSSHPATMITQDATHRFVSDTEKTAWNNKADKSTTLAGYGINNAYTKTEIDNMAASLGGEFLPSKEQAVLKGALIIEDSETIADTGGFAKASGYVIRLDTLGSGLQFLNYDGNLGLLMGINPSDPNSFMIGGYGNDIVENIDFVQRKLKNVEDPIDAQDAATKKYVDDLMLVDTTFEV